MFPTLNVLQVVETKNGKRSLVRTVVYNGKDKDKNGFGAFGSRLFLCLSYQLYLFMSLSLCLFIYLSTCRTVCLLIREWCMATRTKARTDSEASSPPLFCCVSVYLSVCPYVCPNLCHHLCLSLWLSVSLCPLILCPLHPPRDLPEILE
jgi:hypothetical protein